ncbi:MAG: hypothetical protein RLZZ584_4622 [Pseudomonadota bacterium]
MTIEAGAARPLGTRSAAVFTLSDSSVQTRYYSTTADGVHELAGPGSDPAAPAAQPARTGSRAGLRGALAPVSPGGRPALPHGLLRSGRPDGLPQLIQPAAR